MEQKFEMLRQLLRDDRSVRVFDESKRIDGATLERLVALTRFCASGRNAQPLAYRTVSDSAECAAMFPYLKWAGYYTDWSGPAEGQRPAAYLVQCVNTAIAPGGNILADDGIQIQAITLGATALGLSTCVIKSFAVAEVARVLSIPADMKPVYVVALGVAAEQVRLAEIGADGDFRYFHDPADGVHTVPKRPLSQLLIPKSR